MNNATSEIQARAAARAWLAMVWAVLALGGCGKAAPEPAPDAPAGKVEAVEGPVTATRAAAGAPTRALAVAGPVFADDTVITPPDASVSIRLLHNLALWRLDGGQSKRVDQTAAWRASKEAAPQALAQQAEAVATASAGRHSEREAAASAESAVRAPAPQPVAAQPAPAPAPVQAEPQPEEKIAQKPTSRVESASRPSKKPSGAAATSRRAALGGAGDDLDLDLGLGKQGALGAGNGQSGSGQSGSSQAGVGGHEKKEVAEVDAPRPAAKGSGSAAKDESAPDVQVAAVSVVCDDPGLKAALTAALQRLKGGLLQCQRMALKTNPALVAQLRADLTVDAEGKVTEVSVTPADPPLAACVQARLKAMRGLPARATAEKAQIVLKFAQR